MSLPPQRPRPPGRPLLRPGAGRWAGLLLAALPALAACSRSRPVERIVLITLDTTRAEALDSMPETRALLERGTTFTRAYSATSATQPTHASLLTGLHPWQHGVTRNGEVLAESLETLPERLAARGFESSAVVASFPLGRRFGFAQGFGRYRDDFTVRYVLGWEGEAVEGGRFFSLCDTITAEAGAALDELAGERQFLWVHYFDPHDPYGDAPAVAGAATPAHAAAGFEGSLPIGAIFDALEEGRADEVARRLELARALYRRDLAALDHSLAALLGRLLSEPGVTTHLVVTADHGESLGEQGCLGHGKRLTPEQVHVPLVLVSPRLAPGRREDECGSVDVARTLLALGGVEAGDLPGRDLSQPVRGTPSALGMRRELDASRPERLLDGRTLPVEGLRFFVAREGRLLSGDEERVLEDDDPDRPWEGPEAQTLREAFAGFAARLAGVPVEALDSAEVRAALQALGYTE